MNRNTVPDSAINRSGWWRLSRLGLLMGADGLSRFGSVMTVTAIPWFVLVTTGSVARTGVVVFASGVAVVLALLFGGAVVDRLTFLRASAIADLLAGITIALVPLTYLTIGLPFWLLVVLVFAGMLLDIPAQVARYSALPDFARQADVRFERANAVFDAVVTIASLGGPAVVGVLIAFVGASNVLWIDAATFGLSALIVTGLALKNTISAQQPRKVHGYLAELLETVRFVLREPVLFPLVLVLAVMNVAIGPLESIIIPVLARDVYHSAYALGLLASSMAFGGLGGNVFYGLVGHRLSRRAGFSMGFLTVPAGVAVLALRPAIGFALVTLTVVGLGLSLTNLLEYTIYFERLPREMRARGLGITGALGWATVPLGRIAAGIGVAAIGLSATLAAFATVFAPVPVALLALSRFRALNVRGRAEEETGDV